jgi:pyruvate/2-oxoglutarate dehydrogenase complex dihydrolipoamide acyltransferase (E2) component
MRQTLSLLVAHARDVVQQGAALALLQPPPALLAGPQGDAAPAAPASPPATPQPAARQAEVEERESEEEKVGALLQGHTLTPAHPAHGCAAPGYRSARRRSGRRIKRQHKGRWLRGKLLLKQRLHDSGWRAASLCATGLA